MKRKSLAWLLSLVLVFSLFTALAAPANAASYSKTAMVGDSVWWVFDVPDMDGGVSTSGGMLPPGLSFGLNQDCYIIHGTPTAAGDYHVATQYNSGGTWMQDSVSITIRALVTPTPEPTRPPTARPTNVARPTVRPIQTPTTAPTAAPTQAPTTAPTQAPATATPAPAAFAITKQPTRETVTVGGSASFVANAQNFNWCAWRFVSPDGKTEVIFDVTEPHFPGLKIEGGNATTMKLTNIPMELNGWKAVCLFCDKANQWHYTDGTAVITVEAAATATPEPTEAPTATPAPTEAPTATPAPTEAPTEEPAAPVVNTEATNPPVPTTPEPEPEKKGGSPILWILIAVVLLALVAGAVFFVLAKKRREQEAREEEEARRAAARTRRAAMGGAAGAAAATAPKGWTCSNCGTVNTGKFCTNCGDPIDPSDRF